MWLATPFKSDVLCIMLINARCSWFGIGPCYRIVKLGFKPFGWSFRGSFRLSGDICVDVLCDKPYF